MRNRKADLIACQNARASPFVSLFMVKTDYGAKITIFWSSKNQYYLCVTLFGIIFAMSH